MSGMLMMLKSMGLDVDEIRAQGKIAGEIVAEFRASLARIEADLNLVMRALNIPTERQANGKRNDNGPDEPASETQASPQGENRGAERGDGSRVQ